MKALALAVILSGCAPGTYPVFQAPICLIYCNPVFSPTEVTLPSEVRDLDLSLDRSMSQDYRRDR